MKHLLVRPILYLIVLISFTACAEDPSIDIEQISINIESNEYKQQDIQIEKIIPLETQDSSLFGRSERVSFIDNNIYVLDRHNLGTIIRFDSDGNYLNKTIQGKGPGEFYRPGDYHIDTETKEIIVLDFALDKLLFYDFALSHKKSIKLPANNFARNIVKLEDGSWLAHFQNPVIQKDEEPSKIFSYVKYTFNFDAISNFYLEDPLEFGRLSVINSISREGKDKLLCKPFDQNLYAYDANQDEIIKKYYLDFMDYNITTEDKENGLPYVFDLTKEGKRVTILGNPINTQHYVACSFVYNAKSKYFIYSKNTGKVLCSVGLENLPDGELKGMVDEDTFILQVDSDDFVTFANQKKWDIKQYKNLEENGNPIMLLFNLNFLKEL